MFADRTDAALQLVEALADYKDQNPLILAIPRGAVPMATIVAKELGGELDVVLVRKLGAPDNKEYAIGSVGESGELYVSDDGKAIATSEYIETEKQAQMETIKARREMYTPVRPPIDPSGRVVIIIDDGIATGATMIAALQSIKAKNPKKLVVAVPVSAKDSLNRVQEHADDVVCLQAPKLFMAVGQFYHHFSQVTDEEVIEMLKNNYS